jgi:hypothetical protein
MSKAKAGPAMVGGRVVVAWFVAGAMLSLAQPVVGQTARLVTVTKGGKTSRFKVPQVRPADAAVARRINRRVIELIMGDQTDPTLSVSQQLQQAERACC